jgi:hypothetical protein
MEDADEFDEKETAASLISTFFVTSDYPQGIFEYEKVCATFGWIVANVCNDLICYKLISLLVGESLRIIACLAYQADSGSQ